MKKYETPDAEVIYFDAADIIVTSDPDFGGEVVDPNPGEWD